MSEEQRLVTVESSVETSLTDGKQKTKIFVRLYKEALNAGLIADMGAERWQTLCVIALHMNEKGECFPTQDQIAKGLGVTRSTANRRIKALVDYTWQGRPLVTAVRKRHQNGKWDNTRYTILPISQIAIFKGDVESLE
ncbi:helix-turn-helix domain-containing protein [Fictibacillus sp. Mic-4]|uniref:helix-turn-helix domain-containing protein n=1 Tax=Fictibacillus sp. Mic-4 TaxID=3132826 RepID=UPI003CE959D8